MLAAALSLLQVQSAVPAQLGTVVRPETVTVGQHFTATVRVRVPAGTRVAFPLGPDSSAHVDTTGPVARRSGSGTNGVEATATYLLAAWDTGRQSLGLGGVSVTAPSGERAISLAGLSVYVQSVLPRDTALRKPRPPRPQVTVTAFNWLPWLIAAAIALLAAIVAWLWRRRRRREAVPLAPLEWAELEFARLDESGLARSEPERYASATAGVLRKYLTLIDPALAQWQTSRELLETLGGSTVVPAERLAALLEPVDRVKFAGDRAGVDEALSIGRESRELVREVDARIRAAADAAELARTRKAAA